MFPLQQPLLCYRLEEDVSPQWGDGEDIRGGGGGSAKGRFCVCATQLDLNGDNWLARGIKGIYTKTKSFYFKALFGGAVRSMEYLDIHQEWTPSYYENTVFVFSLLFYSRFNRVVFI